MDLNRLKQEDHTLWRIEPFGDMRVPGIIYGTESLVREMDDKVYDQLVNVATLPGIVKASYAMPDAHWGYGFPIGGVAAFDAGCGGVISAGGVGFDISCGVRLLTTGLAVEDIEPMKEKLADELFRHIPAGMGKRSKSPLVFGPDKIDEILAGGARWAVENGFGLAEDLNRIEERGCMPGAMPDQVSSKAKQRQADEMGTLGSGNHYLELQRVSEVFDQSVAAVFGLAVGDVVISIHCGSRGLGHQIGTEFLREMVLAAGKYGIKLPDQELACVPIRSSVGQSYLGAMRAGINCALANRQMITAFVREVFDDLKPQSKIRVLYDVSHNTCKEEKHEVDGKMQRLFVHRKGATRSFGPGRMDLPKEFANAGQPVIIGGSMGTSSYVLAGLPSSEDFSFSSSCHGAGRKMSRNQAKKLWSGRKVVSELAYKGILIRSHSYRGVAEEAPGAYKSVEMVVDAAQESGLSKKVVRLAPMICVKG